MKNFKKLSREELKNTFGGLRACSLVVRQPNGSYITYSGVCDEQVVTYYDGYGGSGYSTTKSFCNTGDGNMHELTSNGGNSRC